MVNTMNQNRTYSGQRYNRASNSALALIPRLLRQGQGLGVAAHPDDRQVRQDIHRGIGRIPTPDFLDRRLQLHSLLRRQGHTPGGDTQQS